MSTAENKPKRRAPAQVNVHQKASNDRIRELNRPFSQYGVITKEDTAKFAIGKTHKYSIDRTYINLYHDNDRIIFQTPLLFVPYGPRVVDSGASFTETYQLDASFFNNQYDPSINEFESWVSGLETTVLRLLKKRAYLGLDRTGLVSLLKRDEYRHCNKLSLKIDNKLSSFYMLESRTRLGERINFKDLRVPCYAVFIAEISTIWIKRTITELDTVAVANDTPDNVWGLSLLVHAAQCVYSHVHARPVPSSGIQFAPNPGLDLALAEQPVYVPSIPQELPPPEYLAKYLKMLKMGIPKDAVKHKMILDGLDTSLLDSRQSAINGLPPPPPPPPPPNMGVMSGPVKITTDMLTSVKLKSGGQRELSDLTPGKLPQQRAGFKVDLNDILNIKSKLKKRNPESEPDSYSKMFGSSNA
jgi:hypothetical protein